MQPECQETTATGHGDGLAAGGKALAHLLGSSWCGLIINADLRIYETAVREAAASSTDNF